MGSQPTRPREPQLAAWFDEIAQLRRQVRLTLEGLTPRQKRWRPAPEQWAIVECLDHLVVTARAAAPHLQAAIDRAVAAGMKGAGPFKLGLLGGWFTRMVGPAFKRPATHPAIFGPRASLDPAVVEQEFDETGAEIQHLIGRCDGLPLHRIRARSAATPLLRINLAAWIASTIAHEKRHLSQVKRIIKNPAFPPL